MPVFADYHRTIIGYHGTRLSTAKAIVSRAREFVPSRNDDDWLGHGIYFWEYAPQRAWDWARKRYQSQQVAVVGSMIRLGSCFDLLEPSNALKLKAFYDRLKRESERAGKKLPKNYNARKKLDCAVFEYAATVFEQEEGESLDSIRAVYVPTSGKERLWERSWLYHETHIQLCIRNPGCILGTWLVKPHTT